VPISYYGRTYAEGKNIGWRDGVEALWLIFKFRFIDNKATTNPGHATLESLGASPAVSGWMLDNFRTYLGQEVFEAGCGSGNITQHLLDRARLEVVDLDEAHVRSIGRRFGHLENIQVSKGDLEDPATYEGRRPVDSVLCVNVLEHLDRPDVVLEEFRRVLRPGGHALILVPAHDWLFSDADIALSHRKRYSEADLAALIEDAGFEVVSIGQFNRLGVVGWLANKVMKRTTITKWQARIFGWLLPVARLIEKLGFLPGLSVVAVARRI
jgi:SAM-dependent methyltransferase